jgi:hypothetical protein
MRCWYQLAKKAATCSYYMLYVYAMCHNNTPLRITPYTAHSTQHTGSTTQAKKAKPGGGGAGGCWCFGFFKLQASGFRRYHGHGEGELPGGTPQPTAATAHSPHTCCTWTYARTWCLVSGVCRVCVCAVCLMKRGELGLATWCLTDLLALAGTRRWEVKDREYGWTGHKSSSGFSDLAPSILHCNWF